MKARRVWVMAVCLLLAAPTAVLATLPDGVSKHFPDPRDPNTGIVIGDNVAVGTSGDMSFSVRINKGCPNVDTSNIALAGPLPGAAVARMGANEICTAAVTSGAYQCSGYIVGADFVECSGLACCVAPTGEGMFLECADIKGVAPDCNGGGRQGFKLLRTANLDKFDVDPLAPGGGPGANIKVNGVLDNTTAGNEIKEDILPHFLVRVDRFAVNSGGVNGQLDFKVRLNTLQEHKFSMVTDPNMSDDDVHDLIAAGYAGLPITPQLNCKRKNERDKHADSKVPDKYSGSYVFCRNVRGANVLAMGAKAQEDMLLVKESNRNERRQDAPTLSTWGMILLMGVLLLVGTWMLRRRRLEQVA